MPGTTAGPRVKRSFQPSSHNNHNQRITDYFSRTSSDPSSLTSTNNSSRSPLSSPPIPDTIQSNLLSVGMRVRKSVPEGYKTHKTLEKELALPPNSLSQPARFDARAPSRPAELVPFCGLHKIGGHSAPEVSAYPFDTYANGGSSGQLFGYSSQESNISNLSTDSMPAGKRRMEEEEEDFDGDLEAFMEDDEDIGGEAMSPPRRRFAQAKGRINGNASGPPPLSHAYTAPASLVRQRGQSMSGDFGEAEFLQPSDDEMDDV